MGPRTLRRRRLDRLLDRIRFHIDTFPRRGPLARRSSIGYQPLPWVGIDGGARAAGTWSRWRAIEAELEQHADIRTALDLGANNGFFTIKLAERGVAAVAVEGLDVAYRTALYAIRKARVDNAAVLTLMLTPATIELLPDVDAVVFLSLWHHFTRAYGLDAATEMLARVWERTGRVMFFDTGENEMPREFRLPSMEPDAETWLAAFLQRVCSGATIRTLGRHSAFDAERRPAQRTLFAVVRDGHGTASARSGACTFASTHAGRLARSDQLASWNAARFSQ